MSGSVFALYKLGEVCKFQNGRAFKPSDWSDVGIPIIRIQNLNRRNASFNFWNGPLNRQVLVHPGDLLLAWSGTPGTSFGAHIWNGPDGVLNQHIFLVQCDERLIDRLFCLYVINSKLDALIAKAHGGVGLQHFTKRVIENLVIPLPPLKEQRRVVRLLDRAAEIKRRADAARSKARAVIPALFLDMFGDPATNSKGWPILRLKDMIDGIVGGKNIEAGNGTSPYRILKVSAVTSGYFRPEESKPAPDEHQPLPEHHIRKGDFLFSRANTSALVGAVAIVEDDAPGLLLPDKIWRIEWRRETIEPRFAYSLLRSDEIRETFSRVASGTSDSMKNISQGKLRNIQVPAPPLPLQTTFAEQARRLESTARALDDAAAKTEAMAAALSAEVFGASPSKGMGGGT